jgi:uncharacterized protein (TIGR01777 family)
MDKASGALPAMLPVFKLGLGSGLGSGKQWMSWIGIEDLAKMILFAINNNHIQGTYNAVAPVPVNNYEFSKLLSQSLKRPFWLPNVPAFVLKLLVGEMASMVLNSQRISSKKIQDAGFEFKYKTLDQQFQAIFP